MARALQLARRGRYGTDPNPRVGCVFARGDRIVGEGWHRSAGGPHAEREALQQASAQAGGADCYVTLEPCTHFGRTPPCVPALIEAGVRRIVAAMQDPDPRVRGRGFRQLAEGGLLVEHGLLAAQAERINPGFIKRMERDMPLVRCKLAMSLDGRTALADGRGRWISSAEARVDVQRLRAASSAILTGADTVIADDPRLNVRDPAIDTGGRQPLRAIVDPRLRVPANARLFHTGGKVRLYTLARDPERQRRFRDVPGLRLIRLECSRDEMLHEVLRHLATREQANEVLVEAGANLCGALLERGLADEWILYVAPHLLGDNARPLLHLAPIEEMRDRVSLQIADTRHVGPDLRLTLIPAAARAGTHPPAPRLPHDSMEGDAAH